MIRYDTRIMFKKKNFNFKLEINNHNNYKNGNN